MVFNINYSCDVRVEANTCVCGPYIRMCIDYKDGGRAAWVNAAQAREIAAELIRLADEKEKK